MSATERKTPGSPYGAGGLAPAGGVMPHCLPSRATKIGAFCAPNPGRAASRVLSSRAGVAPAQTFAASPSYSSASTRQSCRTRLAIEPGNRWIAGRSEHSATKSSSLSSAIAADVEPAAHPLGDDQRPAERLLHRHLLVEHHADQQRVVVVGEQGVGSVVAGQPDRGRHG